MSGIFKLKYEMINEKVEESFTNEYGTWNFYLQTIGDFHFKLLLILEPAVPQTGEALRDLSVEVFIPFYDEYREEEDSEEEIYDEMNAIDETAIQVGNFPVYEVVGESYCIKDNYGFVVIIKIDASSLQSSAPSK